MVHDRLGSITIVLNLLWYCSLESWFFTEAKTTRDQWNRAKKLSSVAFPGLVLPGVQYTINTRYGRYSCTYSW